MDDEHSARPGHNPARLPPNPVIPSGGPMAAVQHARPDPNQASQEPFRGVFSTQTQAFIGFGATKRKVKQNVQVYAEEQADGTYLLRSLNKHFIPSGKPRRVTREQLLSEYLPEPDLYMNKVVPMMLRARQYADAGDGLFADQARFQSARNTLLVLPGQPPHPRSGPGGGPAGRRRAGPAAARGPAGHDGLAGVRGPGRRPAP